MPWKQPSDKPGFRRRKTSCEQGFTLIEVLAAIVILSIVALVLTSFFTRSLTYSKANQNKTIMINLARNALFYAEKQDFDQLKDYFVTRGNSQIACGSSSADTAPVPCSTYNWFAQEDTFDSSQGDATSTLEAVLNPLVNQIQYHITITFQRDTYRNWNSPDSQSFKKDIAPYLLPVQVVVRDTSDTSGAKQTVVEGYITDEKIR